MRLEKCLACNSPKLITYLDLGEQPLANSYIKSPSDFEEQYPLAVAVCEDCFHSQLTVAVDPNLLYKNYLYISGTSETLTRYFDWFVGFVENRYPGRALKVLDIASNDGTLLSRFRLTNNKHNVIGVDPAQNLLPLSREHGIDTICDYWSEEVSQEILDSRGQQDVVIAQNVLAHNSYPISFLSNMKKILSPDGTIFLQTSQCEMFRRKEFDTIYHEHHSFFTLRSFVALVESVGGLDIVDVKKVPIHGTSYLISIQHTDGAKPNDEVSKGLTAEADLYNSEYFKNYGAFVQNTVISTKKAIDAYRERGYTVCGYGAAAKGNTFLNYSKISLDFIIDDSYLKWGMLTPGSHIPIVSPQHISSIGRPLVVLILAWNFKDEIVRKLKAVKQSGVEMLAVVYYPELSEIVI